MWWAGSERFVVYLGEATAVVLPRHATDGAAVGSFASESAIDGFEQAMRWVTDLQKRSGGRCILDVQLSGGLARPFVFGPVKGLKSLNEASRLAATLAPEATGLVSPCAVWLDTRAPGKACVAVAVRLDVRDHIEKVARENRARIASLQPWWNVALASTQPKLGDGVRLLAIEDTDALTVLTRGGDDYAALSTHAPRPDSAQTRAVLTRAALAADLQLSDVAMISLPILVASAGGDSTAAHRQPPLAPMVERWT